MSTFIKTITAMVPLTVLSALLILGSPPSAGAGTVILASDLCVVSGSGGTGGAAKLSKAEARAICDDLVANDPADLIGAHVRPINPNDGLAQLPTCEFAFMTSGGAFILVQGENQLCIGVDVCPAGGTLECAISP